MPNPKGHRGETSSGYPHGVDWLQVIHLAKSLALKLLLTLLVLTAVVFGLGRLLATQVTDFRTDIEQWATQRLGQPLRIGSLRAGWQGITPQLVLKDVSLLSPQDGAVVLSLSEIRLRLSLFDSLRTARLQLQELRLSGVDILVKRRSDGSVVAAGLEQLSAGQGDASALFLIPSRISLTDSDIYWQNLAIGAAPLHFSNVHAVLTNAGRQHSFSMTLQPPGGGNGHVQLSADITGDLNSPAGWSGDVYFKGQQLALAELLKYRIPEGYRFRRGQADIELWSEWKKGRMHWLGGNAGLQNLELVQLSQENRIANKILQIDRLGGNIRWQYQTDGWDLDIQDIRLERMGLDWPDSRFSIATKFDPQGHLHIRSGADFLRIEDIGAVIRMFPLPDPEFEQALASIRPHSDLHDLRFRYDAGDQHTRWSARGTASSLFTKHWRAIPGVNNLSTRFWANQDQGTLQLEGRDTRLRFPGLFRDPLTLQRLEGLLQWRRQPDGGWLIDTRNLLAGNRDLSTRSRLRLALPADPKQSVFMDLQTDFRDGDARTTSRYLPVGIMSDKVVAWLDRSIESGRVVEGSCLVRGPLRDFPFNETDSGRFEVFFTVDDLRLDYWPGWPALEKIEADVRFLNNGFDTWINSGRLYQTHISNGHARITDLRATSPLELTARADGPLPDVLKLLRESPLSEKFGAGVGQLQAGGGFHLDLDLGIPIKDGSDPQIRGRLSFLDSTLDIKNWQLPISGLRGDLLFDQNGVEAKQIHALIFGNPVDVGIQRSAAGRPSTRILASAALPIRSLAKQFPEPALKSLHGTSDWQLQLDIPNLSAPPHTPVMLQVSSNLLGTAIDQPPPLGKTAAEQREFSVSAAIEDRAGSILHINYGPLINAAVQLHETTGGHTAVASGDIRLGAGRAKLPAQGLEIHAQLEELDLGHWLQFAGTLDASGESSLPRLHKLQARIDRLQAGPVALRQVALDLAHRDRALSGTLSSDRFEGRALVPDAPMQKPLVIELKRLELEHLPGGSAADDPEQQISSPLPTRMPALQLDVEQLQVNGHGMGKLQLHTSRLPNGLELKRLLLSGSSLLETTITGEWVLGSDGGERSSFDLSLKSDDLGRLITTLGYARSIDKAPMEVAGPLFWHGSPWQVNRASLSGQVNLRLEEGRLLQIDSGLGGRAFGLLTIDDNLWRRLTLDFSNLFEKGFSFNKARADIRIADGKAYSDDTKIKGPAARIDFEGWADLAAETLDQNVTVTPRLSSTLPIAGALIVNPAGGAALLLAQQLVGDKVDKVSRVRYRVTGPWADPKVEIIERSEQKIAPQQEAKSSSQTPQPTPFTEGD